jgi:ABC-type microcin C transport system permease subunit YejB
MVTYLVRRLLLMLPTLVAVMLKLAAVMSVAASPSITAPAALKVTL